MTTINPSLSTSASGSTPQIGGSTQIQLMEVLSKAYKIDKKEQASQPDQMIAYVEEAYANATANMSFEAKQAFWKSLADHMQEMPKQIQNFITSQNDLFNNNPALEKLQKELQVVQNQYNNDNKNEKAAEHYATIAFATALNSAFALVFLLQKNADINQINTDKSQISTLEGGVESQSQVLEVKANSEAEKNLNDNKSASDALISALKTDINLANQLSKANLA